MLLLLLLYLLLLLLYLFLLFLLFLLMMSMLLLLLLLALLLELMMMMMVLLLLLLIMIGTKMIYLNSRQVLLSSGIIRGTLLYYTNEWYYTWNFTVLYQRVVLYVELYCTIPTSGIFKLKSIPCSVILNHHMYQNNVGLMLCCLYKLQTTLTN